jgi:hypothetical protein
MLYFPTAGKDSHKTMDCSDTPYQFGIRFYELFTTPNHGFYTNNRTVRRLVAHTIGIRSLIQMFQDVYRQILLNMENRK